MKPYYQDNYVTLYHGDALAVLRRMEPESVDCIVTSPPYFGLRDYGEDGQIGAESSPTEYVETLRAVFAEALRVLAPDGTLWLNLGDSYSAKRSYQVTQSKAQQSEMSAPYDTTADRPAKNLLGVPWRVAFALQDDGWTLRSEIIWHKPNAMPQSVKDRPTTGHEHVFLLTKSPRYFYASDAIAEPLSPITVSDFKRRRATDNKGTHGDVRADLARDRADYIPANGRRNARTVWSINTQAFASGHFATFPEELPERCILAGCKPGGTVLDPFSGSGTTGLVAGKHGRKYVGVDLNSDYLDLSLQTRLQQPGLDLAGLA